MKNIFRSPLAVATIATIAALSAGSANAFIIGSDEDVSFANSSVTFGYLGQSFTLLDTSDGPPASNQAQSFALLDTPAENCYPGSISISTSGNAKVTSNSGNPIGFPVNDSNILIFDGSFNYKKFPTATPIDFCSTPTFIGLRVKGTDGFHYGYAEFDGTLLEAFAFESVAGVGIQAGAPIVAAIPEPSELALLSLGLVGIAALRRRRKSNIDS